MYPEKAGLDVLILEKAALQGRRWTTSKSLGFFLNLSGWRGQGKSAVRKWMVRHHFGDIDLGDIEMITFLVAMDDDDDDN